MPETTGVNSVSLQPSFAPMRPNEPNPPKAKIPPDAGTLSLDASCHGEYFAHIGLTAKLA
jgi:hypothetical protein